MCSAAYFSDGYIKNIPKRILLFLILIRENVTFPECAAFRTLFRKAIVRCIIYYTA